MQEPFLRETEDGIYEYRISTVGDIKTPSFVPEIKSYEDVHAIAPHLDALDPNNPIQVPGYQWERIKTMPSMSQHGEDLRRLLRLPHVFYEPPELFRYTMPGRLVSYALQGSNTKRGRFNEKVESGNIDGALEELPMFFRPFVDRQRKTLLRRYEDGPDPSTETNGKVAEGWGDPRADKGYTDYFRAIVEDAKEVQDAHVTPPVPIIRKSSGEYNIRRTRGANRAMADICEAANFGFGSPVFSYYHVYMDANIVRGNSDHPQRIFDALQEDLTTRDYRYGGVVLTITGYEAAWEKNDGQALTEFIEQVSDIATRNRVPLHLPRSGWYGAYLTDVDAHGFGSLMNGGEHYKSSGGGPSDDLYKYGQVPLYEHATEVYLDQLETHLTNQGGQVHNVTGVPNQPPSFNPRGSDWEGKFGGQYEFRINFSKPRRLIHAKEAREFRDGRKGGLLKPATRYFERSDHDHLP